MLSPVPVIVAAVVVLLTGWTLVDPIIGAGIGLFIVPRTWILLKQAIHILLEGTPPEVNVALIEKRLLELPAVTAVHDLHVWTITSGLDAMSCHLVIDDMGRSSAALAMAQAILRKEFKLNHVTIQIEDYLLRENEPEIRF
ncbi:cation diffusion facilitator family transporter [Bosea eneae]|uniref:Cation diffusion facilitator family transporter n=1 Tax=Bosea eneae TaxID=151454 RepID=A0ABW0IZ99_9HYPH